MQHLSKTSAFILGISIVAGLTSLGFLLGNITLDYREYGHSVTVKVLWERDYPADIVI